MIERFTIPFTYEEAERIRSVARPRGMTPEALIEELMQDELTRLKKELPERGH